MPPAAAANKQPDIDTLVAHKVIEKKRAVQLPRISTACSEAQVAGGQF